MSKTTRPPTTASKASTSSSAVIKILSLPSSNRPKRFIAPALPARLEPMEVENYVDPDPEIQKFLRLQVNHSINKGVTRDGKKLPIVKPREEWLKEENEQLKKEVAQLREEKDSYKTELRRVKGIIAKKKYAAKKKAEREEEKEYCKNYDDLHKSSQLRLCQKVWNKLVAEYQEENAKKIIAKVYHQRAEDTEAKSLTAVETLNLMKNCGLNILKMRKLRHELIQLDIHNPFASDRAVNIERKRIQEATGSNDFMDDESNDQHEEAFTETATNNGHAIYNNAENSDHIYYIRE